MAPAVLTATLSDPKLPTGVARTLAELPLIGIRSGYWRRAGLDLAAGPRSGG